MLTGRANCLKGGSNFGLGIEPPVQIQRLEKRSAAEDWKSLRAVFFSISPRSAPFTQSASNPIGSMSLAMSSRAGNRRISLRIRSSRRCRLASDGQVELQNPAAELFHPEIKQVQRRLQLQQWRQSLGSASGLHQAQRTGYAAELWTRKTRVAHVRQQAQSAGHHNLARTAKSTVQRILDEHRLQPHKVKYCLPDEDSSVMFTPGRQRKKVVSFHGSGGPSLMR